MSLSDLRAVLAPPSHPRETGGAPWPEVEHRIGSALPPDYERFIETYGSGRIGDFLVALNPFTANPRIDLIDHALHDPEGMALLKASHPDHYPLDRFPKTGGLMPFAVTDNGDTFYWVTSSPPDRWPVLLYASRGPDHDRFDSPMTAVLAGLLGGRMRSEILPAGFPGTAPAFVRV
ncbi:SMI1/KNR4 family protein [Methylorubrum populi]|uniref:SMI1/KNR4 family protein n=1 Tax=Methylobacterium radiotolerans TaxID=31998 RepID=A0ABU7TFM2_9HYPH|nr:SMI1/KNR4 family protein [Methylobacterium sp. B4]PXW66590.1 SUKH superfamily protein [Methylobacterium sp. B4]